MHESNLDIHNGDHQISDATDGQDLVESQSVVKKTYNVSLKQPCILQKNCKLIQVIQNKIALMYFLKILF